MKIMCAYPIYDFYSGLGGAVGGHITHTLGISESFCTLGNEVVLAAYDQVPLLQNARFIQLYSPPRLSPKLCKLYVLLNGYKELIRVIQTEQPDVLYVRFCGLLYLDFIHRFYPHMPIISECNTPSQISMASASPSWLMRFFGKLADKGFLKASSMVIGISDHLKQLLLRLYPYYPASKVLVVPNGVDCERFSPTIAGIRQQLGIPGDVFLVGFAGNFARWHRLDILIQALSELPADVWLVLVGTGPKGIVGTLKNMINCARIEDRVLFTGTVPFADMPRYVASFDAAVVPQDKAEPHRSPIKLYEYMASGKPIVAADVGQIAEIITDGENGLLYDADSPKQLAEKITLLKGDAHLRRRLASSARSDAEAKHSWTSRASLILDSLHRCTINKKDNG